MKHLKTFEAKQTVQDIKYKSKIFYLNLKKYQKIIKDNII